MGKKLLVSTFSLLIGLIFPTLTFAQSSFPVSVTVSKSSSPKIISKNIWGVNFDWESSSTDLTLVDKDQMKKLGVKLFRFLGGCPGEVYNWNTNWQNPNAPVEARFQYTFYENNQPTTTINKTAISIDDMLSLSQELGADLLIQINMNVNQYVECGKKPIFKPSIEQAVALVKKYKSKITYYELDNEPYYNWSPSDYIAIAKQFANALKKEAPNIKIGIAGFPNWGIYNNGTLIPGKPTEWYQAILDALQEQCGVTPCFDFITDHPYADTGYKSEQAGIDWNFKGMAAYYPLINYDWLFSKRVSDYAQKNVALTEWNIACWNGKSVLTTVEHGLFVFESLLKMAEKEISIANFYSFFFEGPCGLAYGRNASDPLNPPGQTFSLTSILAGGELFQTSVVSPEFIIPLNQNCTNSNCLRGGINAPYISAYSGYDVDKKNLYVFLVNRHPSQTANTTVQFNLNELTNTTDIKIKTLSANDYTDRRFNEFEANQQFSNPLLVNIPPISVVRIQIPLSSQAGDINHNGKIDIFDYNILITNFGQTNCGNPADIDGNCRVDIFDYNILVSNFGK